MKIVIVGGVAGGASAAARARRLDESAQIVIFERAPHVSISNCSMPYYLGGVVGDADDMIMMTPALFKSRYNIDVRTRCEVMRIDREKKLVYVQDLDSGEEFSETYDKLVLATGARPVRPRGLVGADLPHVFTIRDINDITGLKAYLERKEVRSAAIIGGGFIGAEIAENLRRAGYETDILVRRNQIMKTFDPDMAAILHKEIADNGCRLHLSCGVIKITPEEVIVRERGEKVSIPADAVILTTGVEPETELAQEAGLTIGESGAIRTDTHFRTDDPDIYAVGDAAELFDFFAHRPGRLALAGPAIRAARSAAGHMYGKTTPNHGFIGSTCLRLFGLNAAATGLNERTALELGYKSDAVLIFPGDRVSIMPGAHYMAFKLIFEVPTGRILGAQAIGTGDAEKRIDTVAALIHMGGTIYDLQEVELCYSPVSGTARDAVNIAALVAANLLEGVFRQVHVSEVRSLVQDGAYIVDVREPREFAAGHIKGAHNIPLSRLRERMDEIPKDVPVYLHCRTSQRSYNAICALQGRGYANLYNISGSFLGLSYYEYFTDITLGREPIVTAYNFN